MTSTPLKRLTETQMLVLTSAAQRADHAVLPLPSAIKVRGSVKRNLLLTLLKLEMIQESAAADAASAWRTDDGQHFALRLTPGGWQAAGGAIEAPVADASPTIADPRTVLVSVGPVESATEALPVRAPTGKLGQVLQAISNDAGATLTEITGLTGWLPHTARAAVTGLRQRGFPIQLMQADGRKAYCRVAAA